MLRFRVLATPYATDDLQVCKSCHCTVVDIRKAVCALAKRAKKPTPVEESFWPTPGKTAWTSGDKSGDADDDFATSSSTVAQNLVAAFADASMGVELVEPPKVETRDGETQTPRFLGSTHPIDGQIALLFAQMQSKYNVSANVCGPLFTLLCCPPGAFSASKDSATRVLVTYGTALYPKMASSVASASTYALGCDASSTYFDRNGFEVHLSWNSHNEF